MTNAQLPKIGELVAAKYRLVSKIGEGGYGLVFRAFHETMGRDVALKMLRPEANHNMEEVERFRREVYYASGLKHPNTITLYDYGQTNEGVLYIVMEYLQGLNLRQWLKRHGPMSQYDTMDMMEQMLRSLREAHEQGIIHRDLKPENIFIQEISSDEFTIKILDFGLSKAIGRRKREERAVTKEGQAYGTPQYMSPEQACAMKLTGASDVYALGLLGYEMLLGEPAFDGQSPVDVLLKQVNDPMPGLPIALQGTLIGDFIQKCGQKKVIDRFEDAGAALKWWLARKVQVSSQNAALRPQVLSPDVHKQPMAVDDVVSDSPIRPTAKAQPWFELKSNQPLDVREVEMRLAQIPMIGRHEELEQLLRWGQQALLTGGCLWLTGEAGIGKSRLLDEWLRHMEMHAVTILHGVCRHEESPLAGLKQALSPLQEDLVDDQGARHPFALSAEQQHALQQVLDPDIPLAHNQQTNRDWAFACIENPLSALARRQPVVFVLEDVQWADSFTTRLIEHWQESMVSQTVPLLLVFSQQRRHSVSPSASPGHLLPVSHHHTLHLSSLTEEVASSLLSDLLPFDAALQQRVVSTARGNPQYLTQIIRYLVSESLLKWHDHNECWVLSSGQESVQLLPPDLETLLVQRITKQLQEHRLSAVLEAILLRAMIIGQRFELRLLKGFLAKEGRGDLQAYLDDAIDAFTQTGVMISTVLNGRPALEFGYEMLRTSLLETHDWRETNHGALHGVAARAKIDFYRSHEGALEQHAHEVAHHFIEAQDPSQGFEWLMTAAQFAERLQDFRQALEHLRQAAALLNPSIDPDGEHLLDIRIKEGRMYRFLGQFGPAEDALREAIEETRRVGDTVGESITGEALGDVLTLVTRYEEATQTYQHVEQLYVTYQDQAGVLRCRLGLASIARYQGRYAQALSMFTQCFALAEKLQDVSLMVRGLFGLGQCAYARGELSEAREFFKRARKLAESQGDIYLRSQADLELAILSQHTDHVEKVIGLAQQALEIKQSIGDTLGQAHAHLVLGLGLKRTLRLRSALFHAQRSRALNAKLSHVYGIAKAVLLESEVLYLMGELDVSLLKAQDAEKLHEDIGDAHGMVLVLLQLSLCSIELQQLQNAEQYTQRAALLIKAHNASLYEPNLLFAQGLLNEARGDFEHAVDCYDEALQTSQRIQKRDLESLAAVSLAKLHLIFGDLHAMRQEAPLALSRAESLGYLPALVFALTLNTLLARIDRQPEVLASNLRRLRVLHDGTNPLDLRIPQKLIQLAHAINDRHGFEKGRVLIVSIVELLKSIGNHGQAMELTRALLRAS